MRCFIKHEAKHGQRNLHTNIYGKSLIFTCSYRSSKSFSKSFSYRPLKWLADELLYKAQCKAWTEKPGNQQFVEHFSYSPAPAAKPSSGSFALVIK